MIDARGGFESVLKLKQSLLNDTTCGVVARKVYGHFRDDHKYNSQPRPTGRNEGVNDLLREWATSQHAIYLVCVNFSKTDYELSEDLGAVSGLEGWKWEHMFVVHQHGLDLMIYQAFVSSYTLREWCSGEFSKPSEAPKRELSPQNGANVPNRWAHAWYTNLAFFALASKDEAFVVGKRIFGGDDKSNRQNFNLCFDTCGAVKVRWVKRTAKA